MQNIQFSASERNVAAKLAPKQNCERSCISYSLEGEILPVLRSRPRRLACMMVPDAGFDITPLRITQVCDSIGLQPDVETN